MPGVLIHISYRNGTSDEVTVSPSDQWVIENALRDGRGIVVQDANGRFQQEINPATVVAARARGVSYKPWSRLRVDD